MAGHSHWAGIKHKKAAADAKRGKVFSKHAKLIIIAARDGGGDPSQNLSLKIAIERAKADNMPNDNIDRAIKRGTGELGDVTYTELVYEGFTPGKVAVVVDILTDNRNRTASEFRTLFEKKGGNLGNPGSVAWMFETRGVFELAADSIGEEEIMELALESGAEDVQTSETTHRIECAPENFSELQKVLTEKELKLDVSEVMRVPTTLVALDDIDTVRKVLAFVSALEDHDDVQKLSLNFDVPDEIFEQLSKE